MIETGYMLLFLAVFLGALLIIIGGFAVAIMKLPELIAWVSTRMTSLLAERGDKR